VVQFAHPAHLKVPAVCNFRLADDGADCHHACQRDRLATIATKIARGDDDWADFAYSLDSTGLRTTRSIYRPISRIYSKAPSKAPSPAARST